MMIDSHAHYSHARFDGSFRHLACTEDGQLQMIQVGARTELLTELRAAEIIGVIEPGITLKSNEAVLSLAQLFPGYLFPAIGVHPTRAPDERWQDRKLLNSMTEHSNVIAIGETGLDYHRARETQHRLAQVAWFVYQIHLANDRRLPLILHIRQADQAALRILRLYHKSLHGGVVHCFSGDYKMAEAYIELGFTLGIGGTLLQDNDRGQTLCETVRRIPLSAILVETDAPYVLPDCAALAGRKALQKVRNTSLILPSVIQRIGELRDTKQETIENAILGNTLRTFPKIISP